MQDRELRELIIQQACAMHKDGLTVANSGNISARNSLGYLITPTGVSYESLQPADIVQMNLQGDVLEGRFKPSSEWKIHNDLYLAKQEVNAVVHAHSPYATALSILRQPIPAFHYMVALIGGSQIPCAKYATFGTQALSDNIEQAMQGYSACLMANHGMIAVGKNLLKAYQLALEVESLCEQYSKAKSLGETLILLSEQEMIEAKNAFAVYGQAQHK